MDLSTARNLKATAKVLVLVAAFADSTAAVSQRPDASAEDIIERLQAEIQDVRSTDGPASAELIEPLTALGSVFRENGEHIPALAATRQAQELIRRNYGLDSLDQAPLIRELIRSEKALGRHAEAWELEQDLLSLARRNPDDLRTAEIFQATADRRMEVLERYTRGEWPPEIFLGCYYGSGAMMNRTAMDCRSGSRQGVRRRLAGEARALYAQSANIILRNEQFGSNALPPLLNELVHSSYQFGNARLGERSIRFLIAYQAVNAEPLHVQLETFMQLADWKLLNADNRKLRETALGLYEDIYGFTRDLGILESTSEAVFSPKVPVMLPAFVPNSLVTERTSDTRGYIDIAFDVTRHGEGRNIAVVAITGNVERIDKRRLVRTILRSRFRPQVSQGRFADSSRVEFRYFLNDAVREW